MTESQPYIHHGLHLQLPWQEIHLCMLAEILNIPKLPQDAQGNVHFFTVSHKVAYELWAVVERQWRFTQCL